MNSLLFINIRLDWTLHVLPFNKEYISKEDVHFLLFSVFFLVCFFEIFHLCIKEHDLSLFVSSY